MSQDAGVLDLTFKAGVDLTDLKYHFVKLDANGDVVACGANEVPTGILQNEPDTIGRAARVRMLGTSKLVMSDACVEGAMLASTATGLGVAAVIAASVETSGTAVGVVTIHTKYTGAIALEEATGVDEIIEVSIVHTIYYSLTA
ncbi:MAG: hypothetical protein Q7J40_03045 [Atribacterota bacterium]|nr:hypothetical protein [Atribacterota bacterium]